MAVNGSSSQISENQASASSSTSEGKYVQDPIAITGMACRLPGNSNSPVALWNFLEQGGCADFDVPESRFNLRGHHDGSAKPKTMRPPGGMFLENINPQDFDAQFFKIARTDAISMDPNQRQLLEVVYEGLENAGVTLEALDGAQVGCFVGSYAVDYADVQLRDPEDRPPNIEVGIGRAILSNRISHFLNIKGPSMTIDTACSGSLVGIDVACRYLQTQEISGAIVAASNLYLSPEHVMDSGAIGTAHSKTGRCHTFDIKADGYIKAEAVNAVILKRLEDAVRDGDPIRAIIRGSATNSDGRTPGIASPDAEAQAAATRAAYANANISDFNDTAYLECHGTGTQAGDPMEVKGVSSVFAPTRSPDKPLIIGSIKSNLGHSEPAAGISGLLKAVLSIEKGLIPGNPTFITPNPKIDFRALNVRATRTTIPWPKAAFRRASVNSFGYGGSNAHIILDDPDSLLKRSTTTHVSSFISEDDDIFADSISARPFTLVLSANDESSLRAYCKRVSDHLINPSVSVKLPDLAYTLSERRSRHFHRAYVVSQSTDLDEGAFVFGKKNTDSPRIGFVFTGQGAQWPQMGKAIIETFPIAKTLIRHLDDVLQKLPTPPAWSLLNELVEPRSSEHLRLPEFSQPLVTALQLIMLAVFKSWGIHPQAVVGHSSGEIVAACTAGFLTPEEAIKVAYYRGRAACDCLDKIQVDVGMLAVGLGADQAQKYIECSEDLVQIGCFNSPRSVTLSGHVVELKKIKSRLDRDGHFARLLQVNLAYHSKFMAAISNHYEDLLLQNCEIPLRDKSEVAMFSSVSGRQLDRSCDARYWKENMNSPVRFDQAVQKMLYSREGADFLIEIGPSGALAGPISQIKRILPGEGSHIQYCAYSSRGEHSIKEMLDVAGRMFISGGSISMEKVNQDEQSLVGSSPSVIVDLPNYAWNHSNKYWHESQSSKDWRFREFPHHDLLGSKVLGTPWHAPVWKKLLRIEHLPWLKDHKMGSDILMPASGYIAMAIEGLYQHKQSTDRVPNITSANQFCYRLRNVTFKKALVLEENLEAALSMSLTAHPGAKDSWYNFSVCSSRDNVLSEHCNGLIRLEKAVTEASEADLAPLQHTTPGHLWYAALTNVGYGFGPLFEKQLKVESVAGQRRSRSHVSLTEPASASAPQSPYPMHPACIDGCFQTVTPSLWAGHRSAISAVLVPATIDDLIINRTASLPEIGISVTNSRYSGRGRLEESKNYISGCSVHDPDSGALLLRLTGLRYHKLDTGLVLDGHTYNLSTWRPDISFLSQDQIFDLDLDGSTSRLGAIIDLIAYKKPALKVVEVNLSPTDTSNLWFEESESHDSFRAAYEQYHFASSDAKVLIDIQTGYEAQRNTSFSLLDLGKPDFVPHKTDFDLAIIKLPELPEEAMVSIVRNAHGLLSDGGYVLFIEQGQTLSGSDSDDNDLVIVDGDDPLRLDETPLVSLVNASGFSNLLKIPSDTYRSAYMFTAEALDAVTPTFTRAISVVHLSSAVQTSLDMKAALELSGWQITEHSYPFQDLPPRSTVLILDELDASVLATVSHDQWQAIKYLVAQRCEILWLTEGSQLDVTKPDNALVHGFFRTIRAEDQSLKFVTLDVESGKGVATVSAISRLIVFLGKPMPKVQVESEFVERRGVIYVSRILPDGPLNKVHGNEVRGAEPVFESLHDLEPVAMLRAERLGTLDALQFSAISAVELPIQDNNVEVEIFAASLNFKDVAVTMGIVPENEHLLGLEGAGIIRRVGTGASSFKVGDRVAVLRNGTFANRIQVPKERTHLLPNFLSFEDAATIPLVYLTSVYSLFNVGGLQKGQSVLIHSAAGGVGIACIQLAQHAGAEIYATVGTDEKRDFLTEAFGISPKRIFSSRTTKFASEILKATQGKGIDVIVNSLVGELLDESWRICADGGSMVEIGKKDIMDRNYLSMEPFDRNCSFRAVDFSYKQISDALIASLLTRIFDLVERGSIYPIHPITTFSFNNIPAAFAYMRSGRHIGKIVISDGEQASPKVPVRPSDLKFALRGDVSYLIVGGLKGLCGSLAIHMAQHGAKHLIAMSRSGCSDERSQGVILNCNALGCQVREAEADVASWEDVRKTFKKVTVPIGGVIQGAMVLRDKPYEIMTVEQYHATISSKVQGTWNLHRAALEQEQPLGFFTMLSSISGVVGQKGQANYAAANAFLDAFARYRHSLGLPANSTDLGLIEDVGYVAEQGGMQGHFDTRQWKGINEAALHQILRYSILQQLSPINQASAAQLITGVPVPQPDDSSLQRDARFGALFIRDFSAATAREAGTDSSKDIQAFTLLHRSGADPTVLLPAAVDIVNQQFTKMLRLDERLEPAKSLSAYGLDSLSAVEFRNWARGELGVELTTLDITNATSLFSLCEKIIGKLNPAVPHRA